MVDSLWPICASREEAIRADEEMMDLMAFSTFSKIHRSRAGRWLRFSATESGPAPFLHCPRQAYLIRANSTNAEKGEFSPSGHIAYYLKIKANFEQLNSARADGFADYSLSGAA
jgi:hypothetical protein